MARNEDSCAGEFTPKKFIVVTPDRQPRHYKSVLSGFEMDLPEEPLRYTAVPNALPDEGIWGEAGINELNVAMTETETITSNPRVLGADPLVPDGIGEEDLLTIILPYIKSAREGVQRMGSLLEQYGTYEMNGIGFQDVNEVWWFESVGGHHWIARRVPDDKYVVMPNQQGIDSFDFSDAFGKKEAHLCSADLLDFIRQNHLDVTLNPDEGGNELAAKTEFDVRGAFGSRTESDHVYNTPRAWYMLRYFNPHYINWDSPDAELTPESDDLPWCLTPERKITVEDVKNVLSSHFEGTPYDPYGDHGDSSYRGKYRPIGINRNNFISLTQLRPYQPEEIMAIQWIAMGSNVFNAFIPFYANVEDTPEYLKNTDARVSTENFYWANRLLGALADARYGAAGVLVERYQNKVHAEGQRLLREMDKGFISKKESTRVYLEQCNSELAKMAAKETDAVLGKVLYEVSMKMKNAFSRSDS